MFFVHYQRSGQNNGWCSMLIYVYHKKKFHRGEYYETAKMIFVTVCSNKCVDCVKVSATSTCSRAAIRLIMSLYNNVILCKYNLFPTNKQYCAIHLWEFIYPSKIIYEVITTYPFTNEYADFLKPTHNKRLLGNCH